MRPYRSLPRRGFRIVMLIVGGVSLVTGTVSLWLGAWPVTGFFGLDVALVYGAFRLSYRSARMTETLRLTDTALTVERLSVRGERRRWQFHPFWVRVALIETGHEENSLRVSSHGKTLTLGGFLTAEERRHVAAELERALDRYRTLPG